MSLSEIDKISLAKKQIATMGTKFNSDVQAQTKALYRSMMNAQLDAPTRAMLGVPYGGDPRQRLDVHYVSSATVANSLPIFVFLPGGGFVGGDKAEDDLYYSNVGKCLASNGVVCVLANYRLAPVHTWPSGIEDVGAIISWVWQNASSFGGDPSRIILAGHSSGAVHAAGYLFDSGFHPPEGSGVSAGVLLSGGYAVRAAGMAPARRSYFGQDETAYERRSPLTYVASSKVPVLIAVAEFDPPNMSEAAFELAQALTRRDGRSPKFLWLEGHNHVSYVYSLGTNQRLFRDTLITFINEH